MKLDVREFLRFFYWSLQRRRPTSLHMLSVLPAFTRNAIRMLRLIRLSGDRRPAVAIALMEHMGDIVAAEPIARLARRRFPGARICWVTRRPYASLPDSYPDVDHVFSVTCLTEWMLLQRLELFDVVWDLHFNGRICPLCCIPQVKPDVLPDQENYYDHGNLLDIQCLSAGLPKLDDGPSILPPPAVFAAVDALSLPVRFIVIHCVSSDPNRDWPADKWRELIARILATDSAAVVEVGMRPLVFEQDGPRQRSLCGKLTILETAEVIRRAQLFIGIDSGPAHLANAVATPGVILLGTYLRFKSYTPYSGGYATGETGSVVRADGPIAELSVGDVFAAVTAHATGEPAIPTMAGRYAVSSHSDDPP